MTDDYAVPPIDTLSELEAQFWRDWHLLAPEGMPSPVHDSIKPVPGKNYRIDFAWPDYMLAVEIEGGIEMYGRHNRPEGYTKDVIKYNAAQEHGWLVYRITKIMLRDPTKQINKIVAILEKRKVEKER